MRILFIATLVVACGGASVQEAPAQPEPATRDPIEVEGHPPPAETSEERRSESDEPEAPASDPVSNDERIAALTELYGSERVAPTTGLPAPERQPSTVRWTEEGYLETEGFPAESSDGRLVAWLDFVGDETTQEGRHRLLVQRTSDLSFDRDYTLFEVDDEHRLEGEALRAYNRQARSDVARAERFLQRRGFRALPALPVLPRTMGDAPSEITTNAPVLHWTEEGRVIIRDPGPGPIRFREPVINERLVNIGTPNEDGDWIACDGPRDLERVDAWWLEPNRVLVRTDTTPTAGSCYDNPDTRVVDLIPR